MNINDLVGKTEKIKTPTQENLGNENIKLINWNCDLKEGEVLQRALDRIEGRIPAIPLPSFLDGSKFKEIIPSWENGSYILIGS